MINPEFLCAIEECARRLREEFGEMLADIRKLQPHPGWEGIIRQALLKMRDLNPNVRIGKIANKMGECFVFPHWETAPDNVFELHGSVRNESRGICSWCGTREGVTTAPFGGRWQFVMTLCPACRGKAWVETKDTK